jgi:hypothetical protein
MIGENGVDAYSTRQQEEGRQKIQRELMQSGSVCPVCGGVYHYSLSENDIKSIEMRPCPNKPCLVQED